MVFSLILAIFGVVRALTYALPLFAIFGVETHPPDMASAATSLFYLVKQMSNRAFSTLSVLVFHDLPQRYESSMQTQSPYHFTVSRSTAKERPGVIDISLRCGGRGHSCT